MTLKTKRLNDDKKREVPEEWIQRINEQKVLDYWASFGKPREVTLKCSIYRVFRIFGHKADKPLQLAIQWIGYSAVFEDDSASWEPLSAILKSNKALVLEYLHAHGLTQQLKPKKRGPGAEAAAAAADSTTTACISKPTGRGGPNKGPQSAPQGTARRKRTRESPPATRLPAQKRPKVAGSRHETGGPVVISDTSSEAEHSGESVPEPRNPAAGENETASGPATAGTPGIGQLAELARKVVDVASHDSANCHESPAGEPGPPNPPPDRETANGLANPQRPANGRTHGQGVDQPGPGGGDAPETLSVENHSESVVRAVRPPQRLNLLSSMQDAYQRYGEDFMAGVAAFGSLYRHQLLAQAPSHGEGEGGGR